MNTMLYTYINMLLSAGAPSLSFFGSGYARYALTEEGLRLRRQTGGQLRSSYEDTVSLSLRTTLPYGFLFGMYSEDGAEYLYIVVRFEKQMLEGQL